MYKLKLCVWELTLACCFSCKYCGSNGGKPRNNELSTKECFKIADQLSEMGCERVALIGGEIFLRPDWDVLAKRLTSQGIRTSIVTNGYMMSPSLIKKIYDSQIESVAVSLDSIESIHDRYRQEGSFVLADQAIRILLSNHIPVSIISTLNAENVHYLNEFYDYLQDKSIYAWQLQACSPMGNVIKEHLEYRFDFQKVIKFVADRAYQAPFKLGIADNIGYYTNEEGYIRGNLNGLASFSGCRAGIDAIGIDSCGNVKGCESLYDDSFVEGNFRERSLKSIWEDPDAFSYNRKFTIDKLSGGCSECIYGKYCKAGCRSYNYFVHRKLYESPFCVRVEV